MSKIPKIREIQRAIQFNKYSPEQLIEMRDAIDAQLADSIPVQRETNVNTTDDTELYLRDVSTKMFELQNITPGAKFGDVVNYAIGELRELINEIKRRDTMLPTHVIFGKERIDPAHTEEEIALFEQALKQGRVVQKNTPVGISVFFRIPTGVRVHRLDEFMFHGTEEEAFREIMPQILAAIQRTPTIDDIGNKSIEGLTNADIVHILKALSPYRYIHKQQYTDKVLELFSLYWNEKIAPAIKEAGKQYDKRRSDSRRHFKKTINDCFTSYEERTNPNQYFKKVED